MAPPIIPKVNNAPAQTVLGTKSKIAAINSKTPIIIRPLVSYPTFE